MNLRSDLPPHKFRIGRNLSHGNHFVLILIEYNSINIEIVVHIPELTRYGSRTRRREIHGNLTVIQLFEQIQ